MALKALSDLRPQEKGRIARVWGRGGIRHRLLEMGLVPGSEFEVERVAPLGDPVEIKIKGYHLSLRKEEAANIEVQVEYVPGTSIPLGAAEPGDTVSIVNIKAGHGLSRRLEEMGLTVGIKVRVVKSHRPGPMIVDVEGSEIALGHGMSQSIMVVKE